MTTRAASAERATRILIVDDDADSRELLSLIFKHEGFVVTTASSGHETLASVAAQVPDLILLDIRLPDMLGYEVAVTLKCASATQEIPIILISALNERSTRVHAAGSGADAFMAKPVNRADLVKRVRELLQRPKGGAPATTWSST